MPKSRIKKKPSAAPLQKVKNIITGLLLAVLAALVVLLVGVRIFGLTPYSVLSSSMAPAYQTGDLVYIKSVSPDELKVGDVITYIANDDLIYVTHRIDEIDAQSKLIYTKGDANNSRDASPVAYENVEGKVVFSLPKLGYISGYLSTASGKFAGIACLFLLVLLLILPSAIKKSKNWSKE